jgi:hypothetical protein
MRQLLTVYPLAAATHAVVLDQNCLQSKDAMATSFRAIVMLLVLVGLPAAWVYYGPLPPEAMGVIQRTVATAKSTLGWQDQAPPTRWTLDAPKTAPRFDAQVAQAREILQQQTPAAPAVVVPPQLTRDPHFTLASATNPVPEPPPSVAVEPALAKQLAPHLQLLRSLNATEYTLENWGGRGELFRFRCAIAFGQSDHHTRQFEAVDPDPMRAVHQVVGEVTSWQNARHSGGATRWQ